MNQQRAAREGGSKGWISGARIRNESEKKEGGGEAKGSPGLSFAHGGRGAFRRRRKACGREHGHGRVCGRRGGGVRWVIYYTKV